MDSDDDEDDYMMFEHEVASVAEIEGAKVEKKRGFFRELTAEIFLDELSTCIKWANEYGDKYVSKDYFIYGIMGHKRYEFAKSREILQQLLSEGKLQINKNAEQKDCLSIINP